MSLEYIRETYKVPANVGARVKYTGGRTLTFGTVRWARGAHVLIQMDGQSRSWPYHPTWELEYLDAPSTPLEAE